MYRITDLPTDFVKSTIISTLKKTAAKNCEKYHAISMML